MKNRLGLFIGGMFLGIGGLLFGTPWFVNTWEKMNDTVVRYKWK